MRTIILVKLDLREISEMSEKVTIKLKASSVDYWLAIISVGSECGMWEVGEKIKADVSNVSVDPVVGAELPVTLNKPNPLTGVYICETQ